MKSTIDLHIHSTASNDGSFSPEEIIAKAIENKLQVISITDHNTCKGAIEAISCAHKLAPQLEIVPGIEIDCVYHGTNLHILGYGINPHASDFNVLAEYMQTIEYEAGLKTIEKVEQLFNICLDKELLISKSSDGVVNGEIIAEYLLSHPDFNDLDVLIPYRESGSRSDNPLVNFYWDFCSQGKKAYVPMKLVSIDRAIAMIMDSGGIPVLAHPENNLHGNTQVLKEIISKGVVGIEAISSYHTVGQAEFYMHQADALQVIVTCGSDFHGKTKPSIQLGEFDCKFEPEKIYENLLSAMYIRG